LVAARCCTGTKERSFGMSNRKRARALHRWEPAHSEKLRKFDLGCSVEAARGDGILSSLIGRIQLETDRAGYCGNRSVEQISV
jgi:hypothetical protein